MFYPSWLIVNLALATLVFATKDVVGVIVNRGDYTPFSVEAAISAEIYDETQLYAPGALRFLRTGTLPSELDVYEARDLDNGYPILHAIVAGTLGAAVGGLDRAWVALHVVAPLCIFILLYQAAGALGIRGIYRFAFVWLTMLFPFGPRSLILVGAEAFIAPLEITRFPHPDLSFPLLIAACLLVARAFRTPTIPNTVFAAVCCGLLFYAYYFYWTAMFTGLGAIWLMWLFRRDWRMIATTAAIGATGVLIGIPYLLRVLFSVRESGATALMQRVGTFERQLDARGVLILVIGLAAFVWLTRNRSSPSESTVVLAVLVAVGIVGAGVGLNLQLITGYDPQRTHFYNRLLQPFGVMVISGPMLAGWFNLPALTKIRLRLRSLAPVLSITGIGLLLALAIIRQVSSGVRTAAAHRATDPSLEILTWAEKYISAGSVIGTSDLSLFQLIPAVAGTWNFVPVGDRTMASNADILTRYLVAAKLSRASDDQIVLAFAPDPVPIGPANPNWRHVPYVLFLASTPTDALTGEVRQRLASLDLGAELAVRRLDYFILPANEAEDGPLFSYFPEARPVHANARWQVVAVGQRG